MTKLILIQGKTLACYVGHTQISVFQLEEDIDKTHIEIIFNEESAWRKQE